MDVDSDDAIDATADNTVADNTTVILTKKKILKQRTMMICLLLWFQIYQVIT